MRSYVKTKPSRNGKITLLFIDKGKSCLNREFFTSPMCPLMQFAKISESTVYASKFENIEVTLGFLLRVCNKNYFSYSSTETYVVGTQKNRLNETVLLSTQNIC